MQEDRRKFIRFDVPLEVKFRGPAMDAGYFAGKTINVSRGGLSIETGQVECDLQDIIQLQVRVPNTDSYAMATGNIVWKKKADENYSIGVELMTMDKAAKNEILGFAYEMWLKECKEAEF